VPREDVSGAASGEQNPLPIDDAWSIIDGKGNESPVPVVGRSAGHAAAAAEDAQPEPKP